MVSRRIGQSEDAPSTLRGDRDVGLLDGWGSHASSKARYPPIQPTGADKTNIKGQFQELCAEQYRLNACTRLRTIPTRF